MFIPNGYACFDGISSGSVAMYYCEEGYTLTGSSERICLSDGKWSRSGDKPVCKLLSKLCTSWKIRNYRDYYVVSYVCYQDMLLVTYACTHLSIYINCWLVIINEAGLVCVYVPLIINN